jgi:YD repeat-containing protein
MWHQDPLNIKGVPVPTGTSKDLTSFEMQKAVAENTVDGEYDVFTVSLGDDGFSFMINCNGDVIQQPLNAKFSVERRVGSSLSTFTKMQDISTDIYFIIKDNAGNTFTFEPGGVNNTPVPHTQDWRIQKINTYHGNAVYFEYISTQNVQTYASTFADYYHPFALQEMITNVLPTAANTYSTIPGGVRTHTYYEGKFSYLKKISLRDCKIELNYSNKARADVNGAKFLESIDVIENKSADAYASTDCAGNSIAPITKSIVFDYAIFNSDETNPELPISQIDVFPTVTYNGVYLSASVQQPEDPSKRLKLLGIKSKRGSLTEQLYKFDYFDDQEILANQVVSSSNAYHFTGPNVTSRGSYFTDYWGFFNGSNIAGSNVDVFSKVPNSFNKLYNIQKVEDAKGNVSEYIYENNKVGNLLVGGCRINSIKTYNKWLSNLPEYIQHYEYDNAAWNDTKVANINSYADIEQLMARDIEIKETFLGGAVTYSPRKFYSTQFYSSGASMHGYGKVTTFTETKYQEQNAVTNAVTSVSAVYSKVVTYFTTAKSVPVLTSGVPALIFTTSQQGGGRLSHTSAALPQPMAIGLAAGTNVPSNSWHVAEYLYPYSSKDYLATWALGLPYMQEMFDKDNNLRDRTESQYEVISEYFPGNNNLNLNAKAGVLKVNGPGWCGTGMNNNTTPTGQWLYDEKLALDYYYQASGYTRKLKVYNTTYLNNTTSKKSLVTNTYNLDGTLATTNNSLFPWGQTSNPDIAITDYLYFPGNTAGQMSPALFSEFDLTVNPAGLPAGTNLSLGQITKIQKAGQSPELASYRLQGYKLNSLGKLVPTKSYAFILPPSPTGGTPPIPPYSDIENENDANLGLFEAGVTASDYQTSGAPVSKSYKDKSMTSVVDEVTGQVTASVVNAKLNNVAYCSFESKLYPQSTFTASTHYLSFNKGNWCFDHTKISNCEGFSGNSSFKIANGMWKVTGTNGMSIGKAMTISFWAKNVLGLKCYNSTYNDVNGIRTASSLITLDVGPTIDGWTYYEGVFTPQVSGLKIEATDGLIDEVRLHPAGSFMTTVAYKNMVGVLTSVDARGIRKTYEYDDFGRLQVVRDMYGNIVMKQKRVIHGQD